MVCDGHPGGAFRQRERRLSPAVEWQAMSVVSPALGAFPLRPSAVRVFHRITESFRLGKISGVMESNLCPITALSTRPWHYGPCPGQPVPMFDNPFSEKSLLMFHLNHPCHSLRPRSLLLERILLWSLIPHLLRFATSAETQRCSHSLLKILLLKHLTPTRDLFSP